MAHDLVDRNSAMENGLRYFFTGEPCVNGHVANRLTKSGHCCECRKATYDAWYEVNGEARNKRVYEKKAPIISAKMKAKRRERGLQKYGPKTQFTAAELKEHEKAYRESRSDYFKAKDREKYVRNRETIIARTRINDAKNPERRRKYRRKHEARRRAAKAESVGSFTWADIENIKAMQKGKCAECRKRLGAFHIDHIQPLARGGTNERRNIQLLCAPCNISKSALRPEELAIRKGRLL